MKKLSLYCMFSLVCFQLVQSQSIYTFRFQLQDSVNRDAFLVLQANGTGFIRYKLADAIVEQKLEEAITEPVAADEEITSSLYEGSGSRLVTGTTQLINFDIIFKLSEDGLMPDGITISGSKGTQTAGMLHNITFINNQQITKELVLNYFSRSENFFVNLFSNSTRALSPLEKNTRIHLLIVANTNDSTVGFAANKDMDAAEQFFTDLTEVIGIKSINIIKIAGGSYSKTAVLNKLKKLKPQRNDIVVFYYSGHGFRTKQKTGKYPMLDLRSTVKQDYLKESLTVDTVLQLIKAKGARMNLILSDCCNWDPEKPLPFVNADPQVRAVNAVWDADKSRALFLNPKRISIIGIAADVNQLAVSNKKYGSFFFMYFRDALATEISKTNSNKPNFMGWQTVFQSTTSQTFRKSRKTYCSRPNRPENICYQTPVFEIR